MELVRCIVAAFIVYLELLTLAYPICGDGLTLEEELQELTENYFQFRETLLAKNVQLEETVRKLEDQLQQNEIKKKLESQMSYVEFKLQQQELRLATLNPSMLTTVSNSDTQPVGVLNEMATSYEDPRQPGNISSEFYLLLRNATVGNVYCSLTRVPDSSGFRQASEYGNLTSWPVYFYVQKNNLFSKESTPIPFVIERINVGKAMDEWSGKFTTPQTGTYSFIFSGLAKVSTSSSPLRLGLNLQLNGSEMTAGRVEVVDYVVVSDKLISLTLQATLKLESGDRVWLEIFSLSTGVALYNDGAHFTCFNGSLLE
ncbi:uncharacterized protein LOC132087719 [Daphnia carinata]|uniref:uncharacterized protein LOC132087719 n=1 Tax=Daphnia carinata TaxID=120202 RepID=UPI00286876BF|nr:uncharacterized protein LOC132087719 [Daphnia carinata]